MSRRDEYKWSSPAIAQEKATLSFQTAELCQAEGAQAAATFLQDRIAYLQSEESAQHALQRFVAIIFLLDWHNRHKVLQSTQIGQLADAARTILKAYGIHPDSSNLSWLHGEIELALAQSRRREGRFFEASWHSAMALFHGRKSGFGDAGYPYLVTGLRSMRLGNFDLAFDALVKAEEQSQEPARQLQARLCRIQILRLRGLWADARFLIDQTRAASYLTDDARLELAWEEYCIDAVDKGDLTGMINATGRSGSHRQPSYMLEVTLWVKAVATKAMLQRVPKVESVKRAFPQAINRGSLHYQFYECAQQLDLCYDNEIPVHLRLGDLGRQLAKADRLLTIDKELLFWAASARWLARYHQPLMAVLCAEQYKALSLKMSGGVSPDLLALQLDYNPWGRKELTRIDQEAIAVPLESLATSRIDRAAAISRMTIGLAGAKIRSKLRRAFASTEEVERIIAEEYQEMGGILIKAIGAMKGPTVKLAQLISFASPQLPQEVQAALQKTQDATHPVNTDLIVNVIETSLGKPIGSMFARFDRTPLAAASIGQIHRAALLDGTEVVVKAQYPGIRDVIRSDMRMIRMIKFVFHRIFPSANVEEVIAENEKHLLDECDYEREGGFQMQIASDFSASSEIVIPKVHRELSSREVLTMDYIEGLPFDEFMQTASAEEKQRAGLAIFRFGMTALLQHGNYNADPHPGNYLFLEDGRIAILDFGFAERFPPQRRELLKSLLTSLIDGHTKQFLKLLTDAGYIADPERFDFKAVEDAMSAGIEFLQEGKTFRFSEAFVRHGIFKILMGSDHRRFVRHPVEDIRLLRFLWCLHAILGVLEVEADWGALLRQILAGEDKNRQEVG